MPTGPAGTGTSLIHVAHTVAERMENNIQQGSLQLLVANGSSSPPPPPRLGGELAFNPGLQLLKLSTSFNVSHVTLKKSTPLIKLGKAYSSILRGYSRGVEHKYGAAKQES